MNKPIGFTIFRVGFTDAWQQTGFSRHHRIAESHEETINDAEVEEEEVYVEDEAISIRTLNHHSG